MARSTDEIKTQMDAAIAADPLLSNKLSNESSTSVYRLFRYIVAHIINVFEHIFDTFKSDMEVKFRTLKPHTLNWYVSKAKNFQFGYLLPPFEEFYDNSALTDAQILASKICSQAACTRAVRQNGKPYLRLKVAKGVAPSLDKLNPIELTSIKSYMDQIVDAGVDLSVESTEADEITMIWHIMYNPQIVDSGGNRIADGTPVIRNAIIAYLQNLPFNGKYYPAAHNDYIRHTEGVVECLIDNVQFKAFGSNSYFFPGFSGETPTAGWLKFYNPQTDLVIYFSPHEQ